MQRRAVDIGHAAQTDQPHQVVFGFFVDHVHDVIERHHTDQSAGFGVGHRRRGKAVLTEGVGQFFLIQLRREDPEVALRNVGQGHRAASAQHVADRDGADRAVGFVNQIDVIEVIGEIGIGAQEVDGLTHVPVGRDGHKFPRHQASGRGLRIAECVLDGPAGGFGQVGEDLLLGLFVEVFEHVDPVVGIQLGQALGNDVVVEGVEDVFEDHALDLDQQLGRQLVAKDFHDCRPVIAGQAFEHVAKVGRVERQHLRAHGFELAGANSIDEFGEQGFDGAGVIWVRSRGAGLCRFVHEHPPCAMIFTLSWITS
ncbi:MAG: Uncharacterised protein [Rhodospirillaceae bacterium]|nr:MAG: Uncharacterised protein [Rhodospirillaceae bacterium]